VGRQIIKVLSRPTNNAEQFCGQRQGSIFKCEHIKKFGSRFDKNFDLRRINLSSFVVCFKAVPVDCTLTKY